MLKKLRILRTEYATAHSLCWEVKNMSLLNCNCRCSCTGWAVIAGAIIGVITAFLQITGVITVTPVFLWIAFGIGVVYLEVLVLASALAGCTERSACRCSALNTLLTGSACYVRVLAECEGMT